MIEKRGMASIINSNRKNELDNDEHKEICNNMGNGYKNKSGQIYVHIDVAYEKRLIM